mgnify:CR=1 FL=1
MSEERPYLQIPAPSEEDMRRHEEWLKSQEQKDDSKEDSPRVIIIEL